MITIFGGFARFLKEKVKFKFIFQQFIQLTHKYILLNTLRNIKNFECGLAQLRARAAMDPEWTRAARATARSQTHAPGAKPCSTAHAHKKHCTFYATFESQIFRKIYQ